MRHWLFVLSLLGTAWLVTACGREPCPSGQVRIIDTCYEVGDAGARGDGGARGDELPPAPDDPELDDDDDGGSPDDEGSPAAVMDASTKPDGGTAATGSACKEGYAQSGGQCVDTDECFEGTHACHLSAKCENKPGTYDCVCPLGLAGGGREGFACSSRLSVGPRGACALRGKDIQCWGTNSLGYDGLNAADVWRVAPTPPAMGVSSGLDYSCALLEDGGIACWGANGDGQLGDGTTLDRIEPRRVLQLSNARAIATGSSHSCAVLSDGSGRCWGLNTDGQLGNGTFAATKVPVQPKLSGKVASIAVGGSNTCAVLRSGAVECWGKGALGSSTVTRSATPVLVEDLRGVRSLTTALVSSNLVCASSGNAPLCWTEREVSGLLAMNGWPDKLVFNSRTPALPELLGSQVALGFDYVCWWSDKGDALCSGNSMTRRLPASKRVLSVGVGLYTSCALLEDGAVACWMNIAPSNTFDERWSIDLW